ncbi:MAG: MurR/RpiR family transcriptional regulator [Marivita sp.]|uniref:MurR/RpiR family transcriptional regulator n=1 Tax=Marivita sp. TaxID=2003365 RepID=UPI003EF4CB9A
MHKPVYLHSNGDHFGLMTSDVTKPFLLRVRDALPDLHPSEQKLADLVLDFPGEMAGYTATEIAELANVSNATVSRFVRRIGYSSFDEARRAVRDEQRAGTALLRFASETPHQGGGVASHFETSQQNLDLTYGGLDDAVIDSLSKAMIAAPRVWFIGFRAGQAFAQYLGWQTSQVLNNVTILPRAGETLAESMASLSKADIVILVALRRKPKLVAAVADAARHVGAAFAVIEDRPGPEAVDARWQLSCVTSANGPLMNHVGTMAVCNLVAARTIELSGPAGRSRMAAIEDGHRRFDEL